MGLRFFGFQNSTLLSGPPNALPTAQTYPFLPRTATSKFFGPSTRISASRDIDAGAAVRASAISASRSIWYCAIGAMVGYGDGLAGACVPCAWTGAAAPDRMASARLPQPTTLPAIRGIVRLLFEVSRSARAVAAMGAIGDACLQPGPGLEPARRRPGGAHSNPLAIGRYTS